MLSTIYPLEYPYRYLMIGVSSLNVSGFTTLNNTTNINAPLNVSGINILQTLIIIVQIYQYYLIQTQIYYKH